MNRQEFLRMIRKIVTFKGFMMVMIGSILQAITINLFYHSSGLYSLGVTGLSMIASSTLEGTGFDFGMSFWLLVLNFPLLILAIKKLGNRFTFYTIQSVVMVSLFVRVVPTEILMDDILLNAIMGGLIYGVGITLTLKAGGSTGGTDILSLYYSFRGEMSIGQLALMMNAAIALLAGLQANIEIALYTVMASYITSSLIDKFHTRYKKIRIEIITENGEELSNAILAKIHRGMTRVDVTGGYSKVHKEMLIIIITSYELINLRDVVAKVDPSSFVSISDCKGIIGNFFNNDSLD